MTVNDNVKDLEENYIKYRSIYIYDRIKKEKEKELNLDVLIASEENLKHVKINMLISKYNYYKIEKVNSLSHLEYNDLYFILNLITGIAETEKNILINLIKHEIKYLELNKFEFISEFIQDRKQLFFNYEAKVSIEMAQEIDKKHINKELNNFKYTMLDEIEILNEYYENLNINNGLDKKIISLMILSKIVYKKDINSNLLSEKNNLKQKSDIIFKLFFEKKDNKTDQERLLVKLKTINTLCSMISYF